MIPRSAMPSVRWPAMTDRRASTLLSVLYQFGASERLPPVERERRQMTALRHLLAHAAGTVPYYRGRAAYSSAAVTTAARAELDFGAWRRLPVISRIAVQDAGESMFSESVPQDHGSTGTQSTSGSTGRPLTALTTQVTATFWNAVTLRELLWRRRDVTGVWASIRTDRNRAIPPEGVKLANWGPPVSMLFDTGPSYALGVQYDVALQARWLHQVDPDYLLSLPSNLEALAEHYASHGMTLPRLKGVSAYGETLGSDVRSAVRAAWGVELSDMYSSQEVGYLALQCPEFEHYHVQSEVALVEVLDDDLRPCAPGEVGRVVVTPLHNYAMPLLRYEIGDYAEVGEPCPCGRTLPVLERILGRRRNMLVLPGGQRMWPTFGKIWREIGVIRQLQLVQHDIQHIEARVVSVRPLTAEEEANFGAIVHERFGHPFRVSFTYLERIERPKNLKFEDFISLV